MTSKIRIDTHMHSKASDGMWTPREVVAQAKARGLEVIALTDHDTTFGLAEALLAGEELGVRVIPGIEIDAVYDLNGKSVKNIELLGLNIDQKRIRPFADKRAQDRISLLEDYISQFNAYLCSPRFEEDNSKKQFKLTKPRRINLAEVIEWYNIRNTDLEGRVYDNPAPFLSKMTLVKYIAHHFLSEEQKKAIGSGDPTAGEQFKKEYKSILAARKETKPTFYQAIAIVKAAGGIAIVAHPGLSKGYEDGMVKEWERPESEWFSESSSELTPYKFIKDLVAHGLDGVELYNYSGNEKAHAAHHDLINRYFATLAMRLNIRTTYGSDCHGPKGKGPLLGTFGSSQIYL